MIQAKASLKHEFVEYIPVDLEDGTLYVSMPFGIVVHKCCCGCGNKVFTPLSPTDWKLIYDGESISLKPSIGNWGFSCQSHYWIIQNGVSWASQWSQKEIETGRASDAAAKEKYFGSTKQPADSYIIPSDETKVEVKAKNIWDKIKAWLFGKS